VITKSDLKDWTVESLRALGGSGRISDICKHIWDHHEQELRSDAEFNVSSYVDCFISENLVRKFLKHKTVKLNGGVEQEIKDWKKREEDRKAEANISFDIRRDNDDLSYLGMDALAFSAEGSKDTTKQSLWQDAVNFRPVRNAVGHTGVLTENAKNHLRLVVENIKGRLRNLLSS
jgi:hypothetical protein